MGQLLFGHQACQVGVVIFGRDNQWYVDDARRRGLGVVFCDGYAELWAY